jgi:hypothetical protein
MPRATEKSSTSQPEFGLGNVIVSRPGFLAADILAESDLAL